MKLCYHITFFYNENRIKYLLRIINEANKYDYKTDIFIHTNINFQINNLIEYKNGNINIIVHNLENINPFKLTWLSRDLIKNQINDYDIFIYSEDDLLIYNETLSYWNNNKDICLDNNYNLGFLRIEYINLDDIYITDISSKFTKEDIIEINNKKFLLNNKNPYCGFWIYDKNIMKKFIKSEYYNLKNIKGYELRETSAIGLNGKYTNFFYGTLLPLNGLNQINNLCYVHNMPNNYIDKKSKYGKININNLFNINNEII